MKKRRSGWACLVVVLSALSAAQAACCAETPECEESIAALREARATIRYSTELSSSDLLGLLFKPKNSSREFPCRDVREVQFIAGDDAHARILSALPSIVQLEKPEQITLIVHRFDASHFDDLAKQADTLKKLRAIDLAINLETTATDADLAPLSKIENLERLSVLSVERTDVTDGGLAHLASLKRLKMLVLDNSRITNAGMNHLKDLSALEYLSAMFTDVTGSGLRHLDKSSLKRLNFIESKVDDIGLEHVGRFENLELLFLGGCRIDGSGLRHLAGLKKLNRLSLAGTQVDDASLASLAGLHQLKELTLSHCPITDAGIASLKKMGRLRRLSIGDTQITEAGKEELRRALPLTEVD